MAELYLEENLQVTPSDVNFALRKLCGHGILQAEQCIVLVASAHKRVHIKTDDFNRLFQIQSEFSKRNIKTTLLMNPDEKVYAPEQMTLPFKATCINDKNQPPDIPEEERVVEGETYTVVEIIMFDSENNFGVVLDEIKLTGKIKFFAPERFDFSNS